MSINRRHDSARRHGWLARGRARIIAVILLTSLAALLPTALAAPAAPAEAQGGWSVFGSMLQPRSEAAVEGHNGKIYVLGGYPAGRIPSNFVQVYDAGTDNWEVGPPTPAPLHHTIAVSANGRLFVIGGEFEGAGSGRPEQYLSEVWELDEAVGEWRARAPMPTARSAMGAAVIDGKIYVAGGRPPRGTDFAVYDPATDVWTVLPDLPTQRNHVMVGGIDGKVFVAGGRFGAGFNSEMTGILEIFDPASATWTSGAAIPEPRSGGSSVVANGCLFAIGGERNDNDPRGIFPNNEAYNARTNTWLVLEPMPTPTHGQVGAAWLDGRIHIPGGAVTSGGNTGSNIHQAYLPTITCN